MVAPPRMSFSANGCDAAAVGMGSLNLIIHAQEEIPVNRNHFIANAVLWASAIIASAIVGAPSVLSIILLPSLATCSLLLTWPKRKRAE